MAMRAMLCLVIFCSFAGAAANHEIVIMGEVSDSQCAFNVHSDGNSHADAIKSGVLGHTAVECTRACVRLGGKYVLVDTAHNKVYHLANPGWAEPFAAKRVRAKGAVDAKGVLTISAIALQ